MEDAQDFARSWIDSWNRRDLNAILSHYAEEIRFISPTARTVTGRATVEGHADLRAYWSEGLRRRPNLAFELLDVFEGDNVLALHFQDESGRRTIETLVFDEKGQIAFSTACNRP
jgi:ketosteroid isomerase-like protein